MPPLGSRKHARRVLCHPVPSAPVFRHPEPSAFFCFVILRQAQRRRRTSTLAQPRPVTAAFSPAFGARPALLFFVALRQAPVFVCHPEASAAPPKNVNVNLSAIRPPAIVSRRLHRRGSSRRPSQPHGPRRNSTMIENGLIRQTEKMEASFEKFVFGFDRKL